MTFSNSDPVHVAFAGLDLHGIYISGSDGNAVVYGLEPGEEVVAAGVALLKEGQKVRKIGTPSKSNYGGLL